MNSNNKKEFRIVGKYIQGLSITGYMVENIETSKKKLLKTADVIKLAEANKIYDANVEEFDGKKYLYIKQDINTIEDIENSKNNMEIIYRILDKSNMCIGYMCKDNNGKSYKISRNKAWELAYNNSIKNVKAIVCKGIKALQGNGIDLGSLSSIEDSE